MQVFWLKENVGGIGGYVVRVRTGDAHWTQFEVFERVAEEMDGTPLYNRKGAIRDFDYVQALDDAEVVFRGTVKWDGCSNVEGSPHLCGPEAWADFGRVIALIPALALKAMGRERFG